ncbi:MAG: hypothetical protein J7K73_00345 [Nanoarchaeota archaeon]|nr:hypothetical protein [Nanoarchaeota archaeon]
MAKNNDNMWMISMTVIAIVAIVAVFGLVRMTGYAFLGSSHELPAYAGGSYWSQGYKTEIQLLRIQMQTERELRREYGNDISVVWVKFVYGNKAMLGGIVLNADGTYNSGASVALGQILEGKVMSAPGFENTEVMVATPDAAFKALVAGGASEPFGIGSGGVNIQ